MAQKTVMGPNGSVALPPALQGFFYPGETVEVVQYQWHLGLWREWQRVKPTAAPSEQDKVRGKTAFDSAAKRFRARAEQVYAGGDPETGLYLIGYAVECRLKVLICDLHGAGSLLRARYEVEKARGEPADIMGARGHDLELLLDLAGLQYLKSEEEFREAWMFHVCRWSVSWRYEVPADVLAPGSRDDFLSAFRTVYSRLEEC